MSLFMANTQLHFNIGLKDIENMTPEQAYLLRKQLERTAKEIERLQ